MEAICVPQEQRLGADALSWAVAELGPRAHAIFARQPLIDPSLPHSSDVDLLVFANVPALLPERLWPPAPLPPIDLIWLPENLLNDPGRLAAWGLIAHRLALSQSASDPSGTARAAAATVRERLRLPTVQAARIGGFLEMGYATVREVGVTWDFPALALLWLQIAWCSLLAAASDAAGALVPNVYTRPFDALERLADGAGGAHAALCAFVPHLAIETSPVEALIAATERLHANVSAAFPEPAWPEAYRADTRYEYRYYRCARELQGRLAVAREMLDRGRPGAAVVYLRFWAYSLARIPLVHRCAEENVDTAFGRPVRPMRLDLESVCPQILEDLALVLGGAALDRDDVEQALETLLAVRESVLASLLRSSVPLAEPRPWRPWRPEDSAPRPRRSRTTFSHATRGGTP